VAGLLVVPLVISHINVRTQEPCWSRIVPCSMSLTRLSSTSAGSSTPEGVSWTPADAGSAASVRPCSRSCTYASKNETLAHLDAGFMVSAATAGRYVSETVDILAEQAPSLLDALRSHDPNEFLILDGTLVRTDRVAADEPYYSQKHRHHGMNVRALARPDGTPIWYSRALPGRTHDLTAARTRVDPDLPVAADPGPGRPRVPRCGRHRPHPVLGPRPARAVRSVQPRSRPTPRPRRTFLRAPQAVEGLPESAVQPKPDQQDRRCCSCPRNRLALRMRSVHWA
jgi:hypothetical protein